MVNFITSVGVQQFSVTISSGSTTGTATISAVGSGAFIIYGGSITGATNGSGDDTAYLTLTNSTTITATAQASGVTQVVTGCIIDGDTTNLIKSVQFGTVTIASGASTGTASISAVTNANTAVHYLGVSSAGTFSNQEKLTNLSLSGTTVTGTRGGVPALVDIIAFVVIEFQGSALNQSVQNISATSSGTVSSWTSTITSVNTSNAVSIFAGYICTTNNAMQSAWQKGVLTNGTTFTVNTNASNAFVRTYNASIVEFVAGVLNSAVQRGTTTLTGVTSNTSTITSVTVGNSGIAYLGNETSVITSNFNESMGDIVLTNGTTVTTTKNTATGNIISSWEVFEFPAFSGGGVVTIGFTGFGCGGIVNTTGSGTVGWASCG